MNNHTLFVQNLVNEVRRLQIENSALRQNNGQLRERLTEMPHFPYFDDGTGDVISIADFEQRR